MDFLPEATAAAKWWREQLSRQPSRDNGMRPSDDPTGFGGIIIQMAAMSAPKPASLALDKFEELLANHVTAALATNPNVSVGLFTDYGPNYTLATIADLAGISRERFPWKTKMWARRGQVKAALGYAAGELFIYPEWAAEAERIIRGDLTESSFWGDVEITGADNKEIFLIVIKDRVWEEKQKYSPGTDSLKFEMGCLCNRWRLRGVRQCNTRHGTDRCYKGKYYDRDGEKKCEHCGGTGLLPPPNTQI